MNISTIRVGCLAPLALAASLWGCASPLEGNPWGPGGAPGNSTDPGGDGSAGPGLGDDGGAGSGLRGDGSAGGGPGGDGAAGSGVGGDGGSGAGPGSSVDGGSSTGAGGTGTAGTACGVIPSTFCDVQAITQTYQCVTCHAATPIAGAPMSLITYANFLAPAKSNPAKTVAELVLERTSARTMPPAGFTPVSAADEAKIQSWITAGLSASCVAPTPAPGCSADGGSTGTGAADSGTRIDAGSGTTTADAGSGTAGTTTTPDAGGGTTTPPTTGGGGTTINPVVGTSPNDPWCAVVRDVAPTCAQCHASPPRGGAPMSLLTYADWIAHAVTQPAVIVGNLALTRISNGTMPPGGGATATQIADVQNWVNGGMASSTCGVAGDAGAGVVDPFSSAPICTSGLTMTTPDGPTMRPGEACLNCHTGGGGDDEAEAYALGGTVYPTAHEPNDCVGAVNGGGSLVTVLDAAGRTITLTPNAVGNFFYAGTITFPITARITKNGLSRSMTTPQTSGNCNACHTLTGANGAPGRILEPF